VGLFSRPHPNNTGRPNPVGILAPYQPYPQSVAPDYRYGGTVPHGIRPGAWQGVQQINAIASMGTLWARYQYLNMTATRATSQRVNLINPMTRYTGPGIATGPTEAQAAMIVSSSGTSSTLASKILARLQGS
jgi:hypothetical protein